MTRIALIVTSKSGGGVKSADLEARLKTLGATVETFDRRDLGAAADSRPDRLAVAGGDGSVGSAAGVAGSIDVPLAVIPVGTANNFTRAAGLPTELQQACLLAARGERLRGMELGHAGDLPFVNLASAGLAPVAARRAVRWKRLFGPTAYAIGAGAAVVGTPALDCEVTADGRTAFSGKAWQVMVAVSGAFGPGIKVEPTDTGDGKLDLVVMEAGPRVKLLARGYRMRAGEIVSQPGVSHTRADSLDVRVPAGTAFNVDGEVVDLGATHFSVERAGFQLVVG